MTEYPDFLIIGAAKAGTTALFDIIDGHPDVYLPEIKEPHHFAFRDERPNLVAPDGRYVGLNHRAIYDPGEYLELFRDRLATQIAGEASVSTLNYSRSAVAIKDARPEMKIVAILRNPADRAYSAYNHAKRWGIEMETDFERALDLEQSRIEANCPLLMRYIAGGRYARFLAPFLDTFPREQIHLILYDDFRSDPDQTIRALLTFLEVDPTVELDLGKRSNAGVVPTAGNRLHSLINSDSLLHRLNRRVIPWRLRRKVVRTIKPRLFVRPEALHNATRWRIIRETEDDIRELHAMTGLDCLHWADCPRPRASHDD